MQSVLSCTGDVDYRIIAIDDGSTEPAVGRLLRGFAARHRERIVHLRNEDNLGFVMTVNRGMRFSDRDVVLLNTDAEVSEGWLRRMREAAYGDEAIATVTPLSNEASVYSVLQTPAEQEWTRLRTTDQIARLVLEASERRMPEIPTGVGFCLYIKRSAIDRIGFFDTAFGRGYGEENDWCMRAGKAGFRHVLDDRTFVFHEGHVVMRAIGYLPDGQSTIAQNEQLLQRRHPEYRTAVDAFLARNTMQTIRSRIISRMMDAAAIGLRRIAFVLHAKPDPGSRGGTELHVHDLVEQMQRTSDVLVIYPANGCLVRERRVGGLHDCCSVPLSHPRCAPMALRDMLAKFPRDVVHVHHLLGLGSDILKAAKELGARVVFTIHDYYAISPNYTLTDRRGRFRGIPARWKKCPGMWRTHGWWRHRMHSALQSVDAIIAPSKTALSFFETTFSDLPALRRIMPHGIPGNGYNAAGEACTHPTVCFLGNHWLPHKGSAIVERVLCTLSEAGVRCVVVGCDKKDFPDLSSSTVEFLGTYRREELPRLLKRIRPHLVAILSSFPETFCYALSESWRAGVPACVTPVGALPERMEASGAGFVASSLDPEKIARAMIAFLKSSAYRRALRRAQSAHCPSLSDMAKGYADLYDELRGARPSGTQAHEKVLQYA